MALAQGGSVLYALIILGIGGYGLYLTEIWNSGPRAETEAIYRYLGWAMVVFALWRSTAIFQGAVRLGRWLFFILIVAAVAAFLGGEEALWKAFF